MNKLTIVLLFLTSNFAFASQSIVCREATKTGAVKSNGGTVRLALDFKRNGELSNKSTVKVSGFTRNNDSVLSSLEIRDINQSGENSSTVFTTFFFDNRDEMLDIQLQFNRHVRGESFRGEPATFVIGSDDANPETGFSFGFDVICSSRTTN